MVEAAVQAFEALREAPPSLTSGDPFSDNGMKLAHWTKPQHGLSAATGARLGAPARSSAPSGRAPHDVTAASRT
jgi:hypothetical protein